MQKKHLVIMYWDLDFGGIQTRIESILRQLELHKDEQLEVTLLLKRSQPCKIILPKKITLNIRSFSADVYQGRQLQFLCWLFVQLHQLKPTHILSFSNRFAVIAIIHKFFSDLSRKKVSVTISEEIFLSTYLKQHESWYWLQIIKCIYPLADDLIVLTEAMKQDLQHTFQVPASKIHLIPSWIAPSANINPVPKKYEAIFVGRLVPGKRVIWVIALAKYLKKFRPKSRLLIVGDGPERTFLEKSIAQNQLGSIVRLVGYQSPLQITQLLQQSRLLLLPSLNEGLPMVILEAANQDVPSVITNFAGATEVVDHGQTGVVVNSFCEFCREIFQLLENQQQIKFLGANAKKKVSNTFSLANLNQYLLVVMGEAGK